MKKESLYNKFALNLKEYCIRQNISFYNTSNDQVIIDELYICPLCFNVFEKIHLHSSHENHLTFEDVPPKSLGGKAKLLTCKHCNNSSGYSIDHHLNKDIKLRNFKKGEFIEMNFQINDKNPLKAKIRLNKKSQVELVFDFPKHQYSEKIMKEMINSWEDTKGNFKITGASIKKNNLAHLKIAYLTTFEYLGYDYIFSSGGEYVQKILSTGDYEKKPFVFSNTHNDIEDGLYKINNLPFTMFVVAYRLTLNNFSYNFNTFIPGPGQNDITEYEQISKTESFKFQLDKIEQRV